MDEPADWTLANPVITLLWVVKLGELLGSVVAMYGLHLLTKAPPVPTYPDQAPRLRRALRFGLIVAVVPIVVVLLSLLTPSDYWLYRLYVYEISSAMALLLLPPGVLIYCTVILYRSKRGGAARLCLLAAIVLILLNAGLIYEYLKDIYYFYGGSTVIIPNLVSVDPWSRLAGGLPLPLLAGYFYACYQNSWAYVPALVYTFMAFTFWHISRAASDPVAEPTPLSGV